jgi:hypothetical protein
VQAAADHERVGHDLVGRTVVLDGHPQGFGGRRRGGRGDQGVAEQDVTAGVLDRPRQDPADGRVVDDPGALDAQRRDARDVRLDLARLGGAHEAGRDAVGHGPLREDRQPRQLLLGHGDDELARRADRDAVLRRERRHRRGSRGPERRLEAAGRVVEAGVDHPGVAARLVGRQHGFLLEHGHPVPACGQPRSGREPDDP